MEAQRQAQGIALLRIALGIMFLALLPLVLIMRKPKGGGHVSGAH